MAKDKKSCGDVIDEWQEFVWNSRTHEFLGRTASSWGMILLFYLVFYIFLGGMFTLTMYVMLQTLDDYKPTYQDRLAIPGMMIQPRGYFLEIEYNLLNPESWEHYVHSLDYFLSSYDNMQQARTNVECSPDRYFLQACSGITDRHYGYDAGKPCILIKLNRVIGLKPSKDGQSPYITCAAKADDSAHIGELEYFPPNGTLNLMYFPYYGKKAQVNYSQPLVAIKFRNVTLNADVNVECKINADHMETSGEARDKFAGRVSFKLRINA